MNILSPFNFPSLYPHLDFIRYANYFFHVVCVCVCVCVCGVVCCVWCVCVWCVLMWVCECVSVSV